MTGYLEALNHPDAKERLHAALMVGREIADGVETTIPTVEVNNHVHTIFSFSPYSPATVAYRAWKSGLQAVGAMDHDSVGGAEEMLEASALIGIASTVGCEIRTSFSGTTMEGRKLNNPDSVNIVYVTVHGIPRTGLLQVAAFLEPIHRARNARNEAMVAALNGLLHPLGLDRIDFRRDVWNASQASHGGSITERHLLAALAGKIIERSGRGANLVRFVEDALEVPLSGKIREYLVDEQNPHYRYDLLGVLKSTFLPRFYVQPNEEECVPVGDVVALAHRVGAIPAYPYLGDVTESPTGDKKAEKFEDEILDELFPEIVRLGFKAVTYMPPRNTVEQLLRVRNLCRDYDLMEISGVDINSSRQSFSCPEILRPEFRHLIDTTWALIAHEKLTAADPALSLFDPRNPLAGKTLNERIARYAEVGRAMDRHHPERVIELAEFRAAAR